MKHSFKVLLLVSVATAFAPIASAQTSSTEARLQTLEAMVAQLRAELAAEKAQTDSDLILLERKTETIAAPAAAKSVSAGGTNFKVSGFIDLDAHVTSLSEGGPPSANRLDRDFYIPSLIPTSDGSGESSTFTDFTARSSRLRIHGDREHNGDKLTGLVEMDFLTTNDGNQRVTSSFSPRLRRAFVDYKGFRVGQEWTTFQNLSSIPESASFLAASDGMIFNRQAMIRYTNGPFQIALENGNATVTNIGGARIEADGNTIPDVIARYNHKGDFGNISFAGIYRQLRLENGPIDDSTSGFAASVSGRVNVGEGNIRFGLSGGDGLGRYIGLNALRGAAINPMTLELEAISSFGGHVALQYPVGEKSRFNIGYSGLFADHPEFLEGTGAIEQVQSGFAALMWDVAPKMTLGVEGMYGVNELENGNDGNLSRVTFSTRYNF